MDREEKGISPGLIDPIRYKSPKGHMPESSLQKKQPHLPPEGHMLESSPQQKWSCLPSPRLIASFTEQYRQAERQFIIDNCENEERMRLTWRNIYGVSAACQRCMRRSLGRETTSRCLLIGMCQRSIKGGVGQVEDIQHAAIVSSTS